MGPLVQVTLARKRAVAARIQARKAVFFKGSRRRSLAQGLPPNETAAISAPGPTQTIDITRVLVLQTVGVKTNREERFSIAWLAAQAQRSRRRLSIAKRTPEEVRIIAHACGQVVVGASTKTKTTMITSL